MSNKLTREEFIEKARKIHGDKYDYSKVVYVNNHTKVCIICPTHGEFWQTPNNHLNGQGCKKCGIEKQVLSQTKPFEQFVEEARKVHGDKYNYSKVEYINSKTKVCIICPIHGEFLQTPYNHLIGCGCPKCGVEKQIKPFEQFVEEAKKIHGDKYIYHKEDYKCVREKTKITCPIHGDFWQVANDHLNGQGCQKCYNIKQTKSFKQFVEEAKQVHGDKYDYSKVEYINTNTKVCIICKEHGEFWQKPSHHLNGNGCPRCNQSKLENEIMQYLNCKNIVFETQQKFEWLGKKSLDFYLPKYNVAIECQGIQHFISLDFFGGDKYLKEEKERDLLKKTLCESNGIKILYYSNLGIEYPYEVFEDKEELLKEILK